MGMQLGQNNGNNSNNGGFKKADAFINLFLPTEKGRTKTGAIALHEDKPNDKQLLDWLRENPEEHANKLFPGLVQAEVVFIDKNAAPGLVLS